MELRDVISSKYSISCYTCGHEKVRRDIDEEDFIDECEQEGWKANANGARCPYCVDEGLE